MAAALVGLLAGWTVADRFPGKGQVVRALDVLALGPFLVWLGAHRRVLLAGSRLVLVATGAGTVSYNLRNFLREAVPGGLPSH